MQPVRRGEDPLPPPAGALPRPRGDPHAGRDGDGRVRGGLQQPAQGGQRTGPVKAQREPIRHQGGGDKDKVSGDCCLI